MFKQYRFSWEDRSGNAHTLDFFVHSKKTRKGFLHRACMIGEVPRTDDIDHDWSEYKANEDKLFKKRFCRVPYCNRTWEAWPGHDCLKRLWEQVAVLKFVDLSEVVQTNPFSGDAEPEHTDLREADELFERFSRR